MFNTKHWISRIAPAIASIALALNLLTAHAVTITTTTTFDNGFGNGPINGSFFVKSGGITTTAIYSGSPTTPNSLTGPLTDILDGSGFNGSASVTDTDPVTEFGIGFDTNITVLNNTGSQQTVSFRLDFSNMVNADGDDAFSDSELILQEKLVGDLDFTEVFFSDLVSDTSFGDAVGGVGTGLFGESLMENGSQIFSYTLNDSEQIELQMSWTLSGGVFPDVGLAEANLTAELTLVPLPGSLLFMVSGMLLLPLQRLLRK